MIMHKEINIQKKHSISEIFKSKKNKTNKISVGKLTR